MKPSPEELARLNALGVVYWPMGDRDAQVEGAAGSDSRSHREHQA